LVLLLSIISLGAAPKPTPLAAQIQTDLQFVIAAEQLLTKFEVPGSSHAALVPVYEAWLRRQRVHIYRINLLDHTGLLGFAGCPAGPRGHVCIIFLDDQIEPNQQLDTLLHEAAHTRLHGKTGAESEMIAKIVAYLTNKALGLDTRAATMSYLYFHTTETTRHDVLTRYEKQILKLVEEFVQVAKGKS
jgi:hypothetical protein